MPELFFNDHKVTYKDDDETKQEVFNRLIEFFTEHHAFSGETICQSDNPQIYAPELLSDIADDIIQFETTYDDD